MNLSCYGLHIENLKFVWMALDQVKMTVNGTEAESIGRNQTAYMWMIGRYGSRSEYSNSDFPDKISIQ